MNVTDAQIFELLKKYCKYTVLGFSADHHKPSHKVSLYMRSKGYEIAGVHPEPKANSTIKVYQSLADVPPEFRHFVNVFRRPEFVPAVVDELLSLGGVEVLWLQMGITHPQAEAKAEAAGLKVVANRCLHIEFERMERG